MFLDSNELAAACALDMEKKFTLVRFRRELTAAVEAGNLDCEELIDMLIEVKTSEIKFQNICSKTIMKNLGVEALG